MSITEVSDMDGIHNIRNIDNTPLKTISERTETVLSDD